MTMQIKVPIEVKMNMDEIIDRLKEDDFVQVVRCKDCKYSVRRGRDCTIHWWGTKEDDYCSHAERRENE